VRNGMTAAVTIVDSRRSGRLLGLVELFRHRGLLLFFVWRDIKVQYKQAVLGVVWGVIQPFLKMIVFSIVFGNFARMESEGFPYPIFLYAGLLPWQFFADAVTRGGDSVVGGANLIRKAYFPRLVLPVGAVAATLVDFLISFSVLVGLMLYFHIRPGANFLMVIPLTLLVIVTAVGSSAFVSALNVAYRDFRYIVPFAVQIWMYATPVVYAVTIIPQRWRWIVQLNPMTGVVDGYRSAILGKPFDWTTIGTSCGVSVLILVVGLLVFRSIERVFADVV
jgi:lipopolysaccharide transport system permease protein